MTSRETAAVTTVERPVFVVFEGLDGSGKSTCARSTAEALGAVYMTTPSERMRTYRDDIVQSYRNSQEAQQLFYLSTVFAASRDVEHLLASGRSVVLDRYFLSTQAYAAFRGTKLDIDDVQRFLLPASMTIFLDAPLAVRRSRLAERGASAADRETLQAGADVRLRELHFCLAGLPVVGRFLTLDSSELSPRAIVAMVIAEASRGRAP